MLSCLHVILIQCKFTLVEIQIFCLGCTELKIFCILYPSCYL
ncbi:hypothetical protein RchiOBHm_Chr7g0221401 [Rosa chinensis]|uniref:Uncharacterized protein n=1 Tax=Rosa chinensis TaxID=74649 RepID=A0A2P6PD11_ROSCH|nr:hypothetical protein RchiOBHm_Chr7g0221401 [Rosa chinensis]